MLTQDTNLVMVTTATVTLHVTASQDKTYACSVTSGISSQHFMVSQVSVHTFTRPNSAGLYPEAMYNIRRQSIKKPNFLNSEPASAAQHARDGGVV